MKRNPLFLLLLISLVAFSQGIWGEEPQDKGKEKDKSQLDEKLSQADKEITEFESIKEIIKNDLLEEEFKKKKNNITQKKQEIKQLDLDKYNYPTQSDFWNFMSEYWLVKNAQKLNWDFERPDYGLEPAIKQMLETFGYFEKKIKLLLVKTPTITHFALPAGDNEYIFLLSQPFIRTLDLTKLEISLLLLEDFFRAEMGYFKQYVAGPELSKKWGGNFHGEKFDPEILKKALGDYDVMIFKKGFTFQQQFEVTQRMGNILKTHLPLWAAYNTLLTKIDVLAKSNSLYHEYTKIYPSPELQLKWLKPPSQPL